MYRGRQKTVKLYDSELQRKLTYKLNTWNIVPGTLLYRVSGSAVFSLSKPKQEPNTTSFAVAGSHGGLTLLDVSSPVVHAVMETAFAEYARAVGEHRVAADAFKKLFPLSEDGAEVCTEPRSEQRSEHLATVLDGLRWAIRRGYLCKVNGWATPELSTGTERYPPELVLIDPGKVLRVTSHFARDTLSEFLDGSPKKSPVAESRSAQPENDDTRTLPGAPSSVARRLKFNGVREKEKASDEDSLSGISDV